ncbi:hypothetical protein OG413_03220 [Streptomyces sp. NBC_01433]|uniref:hypothetical protein n=1 Tax=Streptomyces sp. NBC_01433 TaxID=2903864 RepID=UPI0022517E83|nr:hypothetical protein [Streptomyces sp. NBC_01433]MCX4674338.1 hypothetical protein [Streptomyces sp. NBC_01433]
MADIELNDDLIELERAAWAEQREGRLTVATAARVQLRQEFFEGASPCVRGPAVRARCPAGEGRTGGAARS